MENKKKSTNTIIKDTMALFLITLIAGFALGFVYDTTKEPIKVAQLEAKMKAYQEVYKDATTFDQDETLTVLAENAEEVLTAAGITAVTIDEALAAKNATGELIGYVLLVTSSEGYSGDITLSLGITLEGNVIGMKPTVLNESPGLGSKAANEAFRNQYLDKKVDVFQVVKTGKSAEDEIDAITGATITSSAVTDAVNGAIYFFNNSITSK